VTNAYARSLRHGTVKTKTRKEVRGGGKKPWKQKGTGRARASSIRSPLWRGGGTVFGPIPKDYRVSLPASMRRSALIAALSQKLKQERVVFLDALELKQPKTKDFMAVVNALPLDKRKTLCVVKDIAENLKRASANAAHLVEIRKASDINAYHVMHREKLLISQDALSVIEERLDPNAAPKPPAEKKPKAEKAPKAVKIAKPAKAAKTSKAAKPAKKTKKEE
jgi:large subunit ribosomal protein L4